MKRERERQKQRFRGGMSMFQKSPMKTWIYIYICLLLNYVFWVALNSQYSVLNLV